MSNGNYTDPKTGQYMWGKVIQDMLRNYMMMKQIGKKDERWGKEHEERKRRTDILEEHYGAMEEQWKQPTPVKIPEKQQLAELLLQHPADTDTGRAIRKAYNIKTQEDEDKAMKVFKEEETFKAGLKPQPKTPEQIYAESRARAAGTAAGAPPPEEKGITPGQKLTSRRMISSNVDRIFTAIQTDEPKDFTDPKQIEEYKLRAEMDIDMPPKYTKIKRYMEHNLATPKEEEYFARATAAKDVLNEPEFVEITDISQISPETLRDYGRDIIKSILDLRKKKKKFGLSISFRK